MLMYVVESVAQCGVVQGVVVVGHKADWVEKRIGEFETPFAISFAEQAVQRGTGDAATIGIDALPDDDDDGDVIIMPGDQPLFRPETLAAMVAQHRTSGVAATVVSAQLDDATGLGRLVRSSSGDVARIVEHRDASPAELLINEINTSVYCFRRSLLAPALRRLTTNNAQGEYYLTDVVSVLSSAGHRVGAFMVADASEAAGVNDRNQLARAEAVLRRRVNERLLASGVTMWDPANTFIDATVQIGRDVTILPGVVLQGTTSIGDASEIGPSVRLVDTSVGEGCHIETTSARGAQIGRDCVVGPFAFLGAGAVIDDGVTTGPFLNQSLPTKASTPWK